MPNSSTTYRPTQNIPELAIIVTIVMELPVWGLILVAVSVLLLFIVIAVVMGSKKISLPAICENNKL